MPRYDTSFLYALCTALLLAIPVTVSAQSGGQSDTSPHSQTAREASPPELPDSPGAVESTAQNSPQQPGTAASTSSASITLQSAPSAQGQESKPQRPVGTAAAEAPVVSGTTAAEPAGVAVAPAKQRRVRTIVLKMGAIIGAGVAVGTVVALSAGTSSKPPGAR
jgi:hypothetical protein